MKIEKVCRFGDAAVLGASLVLIAKNCTENKEKLGLVCKNI